MADNTIKPYTDFNNSKIECLNVMISRKGTEYLLDDVDTMDYSNGMSKSLTRGLGSHSKYGVEVISGRDTPVTFTIRTGCISPELYEVMKKDFDDVVSERYELFYYDKAKKSKVSVKNCLLAQDPHQTTYGEGFQYTDIVLQAFL